MYKTLHFCLLILYVNFKPTEYRANLYLRLMNRKLRRHRSFLKETQLKPSALPELVPTADTSTRIKSRKVKTFFC